MATKKTTTKKAPARKATAKKAATKKAPTKKAAAPKRTKAAKAPAKGKGMAAAAKPKRLSALDAAAQVLSGTKGAMNCQELIETLAARKLWTSPAGKTPHATLYTVETMLPNSAP